MLDVESGKVDVVESELNRMLGIASVLSRQKEIQIFQEDMSVVTSAVSIMIFFAVVLGFAIIYNASVINFAERRRELASLRVMGFTISRDIRVVVQGKYYSSGLRDYSGVAFWTLAGQILCRVGQYRSIHPADHNLSRDLSIFSDRRYHFCNGGTSFCCQRS